MSSVVASANTVVVVGAGIAGLSAARAILDGDTRGRIKVIVLEARDRPGGRAYAALMPGTDINVDLGASWIHGPDNNPVTEVATLYGGVHVPVPMPFEKTSFSTAFCSSVKEGFMFSNQEMQRYAMLFEEMVEEIESAHYSSTTSLYDAVCAQILTYESASETQLHAEGVTRGDVTAMKALAPIFLECLEIMVGGNAAELRAGGGYEEGGGHGVSGTDHMVTSQVGTLVLSLLKGLTTERERFELVLNSAVQRIENINTRICIRCASGVDYLVEKTIITIPLGVLKQRHQDLFQPNLPNWKVQAIEAIGYGHVSKLYLLFDAPFWRRGVEEEANSQAQWYFFPVSTIDGQGSHTEFCIFLDLFTVLGQPLLLGFAGGKNASTLEKRSDLDVVQGAVHTIEIGLGMSRLQERLLSHSLSRWGEDPYCLGAYSFLGRNAQREDRTSLRLPVVMGPGEEYNVYFAGEHTSSHWAATLHGAIDSGVEAAQSVLASYGINSARKGKLKGGMKDGCMCS